MHRIDSSLSPGLLRLVNQSRDKGASSWLNAMPLADKGLALNKQEFRDSLRLRYDLPLVDLPSHCICGDKFTVSHALSCKRGVVAQRHDGVRNLLTTFIDVDELDEVDAVCRTSLFPQPAGAKRGLWIL